MSCDKIQGLSYAKLLAILYQLCVAKKTGTLFVTASNNLTVAVILREGLISACVCEHECGLAAVRKIKQLKTGHYVFSENVFFSLQQHTDLPTTAQIFILLGYQVPQDSPLLQRQLETAKCYRGATVMCDDSGRDDKHSPIIYRGVVMAEIETVEEMTYTPALSDKRRTYRGCHY